MVNLIRNPYRKAPPVVEGNLSLADDHAAEPANNPPSLPQPQPPTIETEQMGVQSQRRNKATRAIKNKPKYQEIHNEKKRNEQTLQPDGVWKKPKSKQKTQTSLFGTRAFDPDRDCEICVAKRYCRETGTGTIPHRKHHKQCPVYVALEKKKAERKEQERIRNLKKGLTDQEKGSMNGIRKEDGQRFFAPRIVPQVSHDTPATQGPQASHDPQAPHDFPAAAPSSPSTNTNTETSPNPTGQSNDDQVNHVSGQAQVQAITPEDNPIDMLVEHVVEYCRDSNKSPQKAPTPICAVADFIRKHCIPTGAFNKSTGQYPDTEFVQRKMECLRQYIPSLSMTFTVPQHRVTGQCPDPHYHSIEGTDLLIVFWEMHFKGIVLKCPCCDHGRLSCDGGKFASNNDLFPIFHLHKPPSWAMLMKYKCHSCKESMYANDGRLLANLPAFVRDAYPSNPKWCTSNKKMHLDRHVTNLLEGETMLTNMNGDSFARLIYNAINQDYLRRAENYASYIVSAKNTGTVSRNFQPASYPKKNNEFLTKFPPTGADIREMFQSACSSPLNPYGYSDNDRHKREIQSVGSLPGDVVTMTAVDHTVEATKNYQSRGGATHIWTCAIQTGEVASAVMVNSSSSKEIAHAAECLARRPYYKPKCLYSDTWPHGKQFWEMIFGDIQGRLGLFHFMQRIVKTLRQGHQDYHRSLRDLSDAVYQWEPKSYAALLNALKSGHLKKGRHFHRYTDSEIDQLRMSPKFKDNYDKWLMKVFHPAAVMKQNLVEWFNKYKVNATDPVNNPGAGKRDPKTNKTLFTMDTKSTLMLQLQHCERIIDVYPLEEMYVKIAPSPSSKHQLVEHISLRGESKLEGYHAALAHYANGGMRPELADCLNLMGTARHNVKIRFKLQVAKAGITRETIPGYWATIPSYYDHCHLRHVNHLFELAGISQAVFVNVRDVIPDNGEVFFHPYLEEQRRRMEQYPPNPYTDRCNCPSCGMNPVPIPRDMGNDKNGPTSNDKQRSENAVPTPIIVEYPPPPRNQPIQIRNPPTQSNAHSCPSRFNVNSGCVNSRLLPMFTPTEPMPPMVPVMMPLPAFGYVPHPTHLQCPPYLYPPHNVLAHACATNQAVVLGKRSACPKSNAKPCNCYEWLEWNRKRLLGEYPKGGKPRHSPTCPNRQKNKKQKHKHIGT